MNRVMIRMAGMALALATMLTSCHSDDPDEGQVLPTVDNELIAPTPPAGGWTGSASDGILKYAPCDYTDEDDFNSYYAFEMKNGICETAVFNVVMPDAMTARMIAQRLNSGTWVYDEDDDYDDDYYYLSTRASDTRVVYDMLARALRPAGTVTPTRATLTLPVPVNQSGSVLYVTLPNMKGLTSGNLHTVMEVWTGNASQIPDHVIFGTYENGVYRCSDMLGVGISYLIETEYNQAGYCVLYRTSITLPNEGWAELYYAQYEEQMADFEQQFGQRPELKRNGNTVILNALILGDFTHETIDEMVYALDWINNRPILFEMFG